MDNINIDLEDVKYDEVSDILYIELSDKKTVVIEDFGDYFAPMLEHKRIKFENNKNHPCNKI